MKFLRWEILYTQKIDTKLTYVIRKIADEFEVVLAMTVGDVNVTLYRGPWPQT